MTSKRMSVLVITNKSEIIIDAAPIVRRFIGQNLLSLKGWMSKQGEFEIIKLKKENEEKTQRGFL